MKNLIIILLKKKTTERIIQKSKVSNKNSFIFLGNLYTIFIQDDNKKKKSALTQLIHIYSKYLNKIKKNYFLKYHFKASKISSYLSKCKCTCIFPIKHNEYNSIPIYRDAFQKTVNYNCSEKNINFPSNINNPNIDKERFLNNSENQNKSAYTNYINLNKSHYYFNGNEIGNFTSYKINNYNSSMIVNNNNTINSNDKKYIVKIKLSSNKRSKPNIFHNNNNSYNSIKNKNSFIKEYSNNIANNSKKIINDKNRLRQYSYKNLTIPSKLKYSQKEKEKSLNNYFSYRDIKNIKNEIITEKIFVRENKKIYNTNKDNYNENKYNMNNNKLIDQQILDYLNNHNNEKQNLINKMKNQNVVLNRYNAHYKDKIINLNNLNNYSYINNNYNYYCSNNNNKHNSTFYNSNNSNEFKNLNYSHSNKNINRTLNQDKYKVTKTIYSNYLKRKIKKFENKKYPVRVNFKNEIENLDKVNFYESEHLIYDDNSSNRSIKNKYPLNRTSKNVIEIDYFNSNYYYDNNNDYSSDRHKIPAPINKITLSKNNLYRKKIRNTAGNNNNNTRNINITNNNNNKIETYEHYDTDKNSSNNYTLNDCKSIKRRYKNKIYKNKITKITINKNNNNNNTNNNNKTNNTNNNKNTNKNIIQKSLNLFFSNENKNNKNKKNENIISSNNNFNIIDNNNNKGEKEKDKTIIIHRSPIQIKFKKNNSFNSKLNNNDKILKNLKKLKVSHNVINEQFNKEKKDKKEQNNSDKEIDSSRTSVQSLNDSKIMELANNYIIEEDLNRNEIKEILNSKKENNN